EQLLAGAGELVPVVLQQPPARQRPGAVQDSPNERGGWRRTAGLARQSLRDQSRERRLAALDAGACRRSDHERLDEHEPSRGRGRRQLAEQPPTGGLQVGPLLLHLTIREAGGSDSSGHLIDERVAGAEKAAK